MFSSRDGSVLPVIQFELLMTLLNTNYRFVNLRRSSTSAVSSTNERSVFQSNRRWNLRVSTVVPQTGTGCSRRSEGGSTAHFTACSWP